MKYLSLFLFIALFQSCKAQQKAAEHLPVNKDDNTLLWEISGKDISRPSYLFGTFHLMCKDDIDFSNNLKTAISKASDVYFEMDLDDPANTLGGIFFMNMNNGKTLKDLYTDEEYKRLSGYFSDSLQLPMMMLQKMKPMFLEAMLYPKLMACKTMSGVEEELLRIAKQDKKEIKGFETMQFQASVFDSIPYDVQARGLLKTLDSLQQYKVYFDSMLMVYKDQQLTKIETLFNSKEFGDGENQDILLDNRNKNWVKQLKHILKTENIFMAVGAGHLVGKNGLIELLRKEGYTVKPIVNGQ